MNTRRTILALATVLVILPLAACAGATQNTSPAQDAALQDTKWVLTSLHDSALIQDTEITLTLDEAASVEGSGGCNMYGGSYAASEDTLRLSGVYATEMGCPEPEGILEQEQAYFKALNATVRYRVSDDRLEMYDEGGSRVLAFDAAGR